MKPRKNRILKIVGAALVVATPMIAGDKVTYAPAKQVLSDIRSAPDQRPGISWIDYADTPKYSATVIRRTASDKAEVHQGMTDIWYVISGSGTLVTGGSLTEPVQTEPDELRGKSISGGEVRHVAAGDIVTIPRASHTG